MVHPCPLFPLNSKQIGTPPSPFVLLIILQFTYRCQEFSLDSVNPGLKLLCGCIVLN